MSRGRRKRWLFTAAVALALAAPIAALGAPGPEGPPLERGPDLAPAGSPSIGDAVDGIACERSEQVLFHIHARVTVYVDGRSRRIPYGIGIAPPRKVAPTPAGGFVIGGSCFTWLHTHAADGVIHIESPTKRTYTLGNFFDVWGEPLTAKRVGPARGHVTAFLDGKPWHGDPRSIPLRAHAQVQLDVGSPAVKAVLMPSSSWHGL